MRPQTVVLTTLQGPSLTMSLLSSDLAVAYGSQGQSVGGGNGTDARCVPMVAGLLRHFLIPGLILTSCNGKVNFSSI